MCGNVVAYRLARFHPYVDEKTKRLKKRLYKCEINGLVGIVGWRLSAGSGRRDQRRDHGLGC